MYSKKNKIRKAYPGTERNAEELGQALTGSQNAVVEASLAEESRRNKGLGCRVYDV